jgi:hypothetical protein
MNRNLVGCNYGRSSIRIAHFISIRWQTWSPQTILVSDLPISNNLLLWNCLVKWAELWWEAHIEGAVCIKFPQSWMKGERHRLKPLSLYFQWAKHEHLSYYNLERTCINRVHLTFSLHANWQNRPCEKEFNTTAFVNLRICNVNINIILWRNLNILSMKVFPQSYLLRYQRI